MIILRVVLRVGGETTGHFQAGYGGMLASLEKWWKIILFAFYGDVGAFLILFKNILTYSVVIIWEKYVWLVVAQHSEIQKTWALGDQDLGSGTNELNDLGQSLHLWDLIASDSALAHDFLLSKWEHFLWNVLHWNWRRGFQNPAHSAPRFLPSPCGAHQNLGIVGSAGWDDGSSLSAFIKKVALPKPVWLSG